MGEWDAYAGSELIVPPARVRHWYSPLLRRIARRVRQFASWLERRA
jgi:hypothetical protein